MVKLFLYVDDSLVICICDVFIWCVFYWCRLYGGVFGVKFNFKKIKGVWLGKWKFCLDYFFGIFCVENCILLRIKFGNNVILDDIW